MAEDEIVSKDTLVVHAAHGPSLLKHVLQMPCHQQLSDADSAEPRYILMHSSMALKR